MRAIVPRLFAAGLLAAGAFALAGCGPERSPDRGDLPARAVSIRPPADGKPGPAGADESATAPATNQGLPEGRGADERKPKTAEAIARERELSRPGGRPPQPKIVSIGQGRFSPDNKHLLTTFTAGRKAMSLWHVRSGKEVLRFGDPPWGRRFVMYLDFLPSGKEVLAGTLDGHMRLYALPGGEETRSFQAYTKSLSSARLSPDGTRLLTVGADERPGGASGLLRLWDVPSGRLLWERQGAGSDVAPLSPDGKRALSGPS